MKSTHPAMPTVTAAPELAALPSTSVPTSTPASAGGAGNRGGGRGRSTGRHTRENDPCRLCGQVGPVPTNVRPRSQTRRLRESLASMLLLQRFT